MAQASKDDNRVSTVIGVSSVDYITPVTIAVNPSTHAVIVKIA